MKKRKILLTILLAFLGRLSFAQSSAVIRQYIDTYKDIAMAEMQRTGVPASITLAQGIHETSAGTSSLVLKSNNHFGIKCKSDWKGQSVSHDDDARGECFRKYDDPMDSYRDHSDFLKLRPNYALLFTIDPADYEGWANGLKKAGYATNPRYPQILIKLIKDYNLQAFTLLAMNGQTSGDSMASVSHVENTEAAGEARIGASEAVEETVPAQSYPSGAFQINETKVVFVNRGTSFLKIAEEHAVPLARLFDFNDMKPADIVAKDGLIFLQRKRKAGGREFHTVLKGETLYGIAQAEGIRIESLLEYNSLREDMQPAAGEKLYLQAKAPAAPRLAEVEANVPPVSYLPLPVMPVDTDSPVLHMVQPKETLYAIARQYAVPADDVIKWNQLPNADLKIGQQLRIYKKTNNASH